MTQEALRYDRMVQDALRGVVRRALIDVARAGFPGDHHFYITFKSGYPGVSIPAHLRATYPDEMTIVMQHQFYGLEVQDDQFEVTLSFNKSLERLRVPFAAVTSFVDPSVNFGLQFQVEFAVPAPLQAVPGMPIQLSEQREAAGEQAKPAPPSESAEKIVSLDAFRKK